MNNYKNFCNKNFPQILAAFAASFGGLCFGSAIGWASPTIFKHGKYTFDEFLPISSLLVGAGFSSFFAVKFSSHFGRKRTIVFFAIVKILGWLMLIFTEEIWNIFARFLIGISGGVYSLIIPKYILEISVQPLQLTLLGAYPLMVSLGILYSYVVGSFVNTLWLSVANLFLPLILLLLIAFMPESPYYLINKGRISEASRRVCWLRAAGVSIIVDPELRDIQNRVLTKERYGFRLRDICDCLTLKISSTLVLLCVFQQFSGYYPLIFFASSIFESAGGYYGHTGGIIIAFVQVVTCIVSTSIIARGNIRILLLVSQTLVTLSLLVSGLYFYLTSFSNEMTSSLGFLPIISFSSFIFSYGIGLSQIPSMLMIEIVPVHLKGFVSTLVASSSWFIALLSIYFYEYILNVLELGPYWTWWTFSAVSGIGIIFLLLTIPHTLSNAQVDTSNSQP